MPKVIVIKQGDVNKVTCPTVNRVLLWPTTAPGALGNSQEDSPGMSLYMVARNQPTACIIICPGGAYRGRAAHEGEPVARWLNSLGVSAVVLDYRVAPYRHPYPLLDAKRAMRLVRFHAGEWGIDSKRIGMLGFSAGGHLTATLGTHFDCGIANDLDLVERESCRPDLLVLCYPVISFTNYQHEGSKNNLLGPQPAAADINDLSNELRVTADTPPTFLWHTANDAGVPVENSLMFASALSHHKIPFELHVYPNGRHGLGLAGDDPHVNTWTDMCARFLVHNGFTNQVGS